MPASIRTVIEEPVRYPLFEQPLIRSRTLSHREHAEQALRTYPRLGQWIKHYAKKMHQATGKVSIGLVTERVRWEVAMQNTDEANHLKINNNHRAYFARWLQRECPELAHAIEVRKVQS